MKYVVHFIWLLALNFFLAVAFCAVFLLCAGRCPAAPQDAVVRINSLGGSGTVIKTSGPLQGHPAGVSWILTSAHMARQNIRITIDAPDPAPVAAQPVASKIVAVDKAADLALILFEKGPLPYVCPVAPVGAVPGRLLSVGYDDLQWPAKQRTAHLLGVPTAFTYINADITGQQYTARSGDEANFVLTQELPWHGRSGGALIDVDKGVLVGVVSGYRGTTPRSWAEVKPGCSGVYTSHKAVLAFLATNAPEVLTNEAPQREAPRFQQYADPAPRRPWVSEDQTPLMPPVSQAVPYYIPPGGT